MMPWEDLWQALENFCAFLLYQLVAANGTGGELPETQTVKILQEQLAVRNLQPWYEAARALVIVQLGYPSFNFTVEQVLHLTKQLQAKNVALAKAECQKYAQAPVCVEALNINTLTCPTAWLLTNKGCSKSEDSKLVMQAAQRLATAEEALPYDTLLDLLRSVYEALQDKLMLQSSRVKLPARPVLHSQLVSLNLVQWSDAVEDLMTVLGTAFHVNRRRATRALVKLHHLTGEEVCRQVHGITRQSELLDLVEDFPIRDLGMGQPREAPNLYSCRGLSLDMPAPNFVRFV